MAIFERIGDLVKANINDLIDRAENPEKMVKQIIIDMEEQLRKATQGLGSAMASQNQVNKQLNNAKSQSAKWQEKAKMCLKAGNEELAKQALANKVQQDNQVEQYGAMAASMNAQVSELRSQVSMLKGKLDEARSKQAMLIARSKMADARSDMSKTLGSMDSGSAFAKLDKMEQKISNKEAKADAFAQISGMETASEDPFAKMEADVDVNTELEKLKQELGSAE
ncbi:MAG: PspA/IM30 family protein [Oscillospiraceae bacterium]|jgi:phage shock protein A|nr:PspA/IM30 family protein [Oscillospiraceae bacterium]